MDVRGEPTGTRRTAGATVSPPVASVTPEETFAAEPLPDLLALDLTELGTIAHPVLREVVAELRDRAGRSSETLWGFDSAL
ncbi:FxSxx-COOH cyclophane-containing RiPP peptide [Streptomyces sp. LUP30]|uniref:FxSxx-COOH cyclophane-containing RiPP peptide n=1 Tax=Streptomyces sp. LUP30 TaxID=1890285 RepID=UPI00099FAA7B|nr:FxSxx-COOH cyclophane-containing RiPP peptide [Streptomyces sp. LUP30]